MKPLKILAALALLCCCAVSLAGPSLYMRLAVGTIDRETVTTTPFLAFSTSGGSSFRAAIRITSNYANTQPIYVALLPHGTTAPANLAALQAVADAVLYPGDVLQGGTTDTNYQVDIYAASGSGSQSAVFAELTTSSPAFVIQRFTSVASPFAVSVISSALPTGAATAANQTSGNTTLSTIATNTTGASTAANQATANTTLSTIATNTTGVATAANQTTANTSLSTIATNTTGASTAAAQATANTNLVQIHTDLTGTLSVGGNTVVATNSFTRPANTTAYASGQLVANSVTAGSVVPVSLTVARVAAGSGMIRRVRLITSSTSTTNASFRIHFYTASPTPANGDGAAWSTDQALTWLGSVDVTIDKAFTDGAVGNGVPNVGSEISFALSSGQVVYALIEARAAYTPTSGETITLKAEVLQN